MNGLTWESVDDLTERASVIGGWLVRSMHHPVAGFSSQVSGITFVPDEEHQWLSVPDEDSNMTIHDLPQIDMGRRFAMFLGVKQRGHSPETFVMSVDDDSDGERRVELELGNEYEVMSCKRAGFPSTMNPDNYYEVRTLYGVGIAPREYFRITDERGEPPPREFSVQEPPSAQLETNDQSDIGSRYRAKFMGLKPEGGDYVNMQERFTLRAGEYCVVMKTDDKPEWALQGDVDENEPFVLAKSTTSMSSMLMPECMFEIGVKLEDGQT